MNLSPKGDKYIWACSIALLLLGCLTFYSTAPSLLGKAQYTIGEITALFFRKHFIYVLGGLALMYIIHLIDYRNYAPFTRILLFIFFIMMVVTNVIGVNEGQAMRKLVIFGFSFQPAEFAKIFLIADLAAILANYYKNKKDEKKSYEIYEIICICGIIIGLVAKNSNSAGLILATTCYILMIIGDVSKKFLIWAPIAFFLVAIPVALLTETFRTKVLIQRIEAFVTSDLNRDGIIGSPDVQDSSQQDLAIMAVSTTPFPLGKFSGRSEIKNTLPLSYSDFVFAIVVEEYGLLGGGLVILLFLTILYRGVVNIQYTKKAYGGYLSVGLTLTIVFQALIHIFVNIGLGPVTGQTLPLISQGGSSILAISIALGVILSVSRTDIKEVV
jgi:cell division protein FtsW